MKPKTLTLLVLLYVGVTIFGAPAFAATAQKGSNAKWMRHISEDWRVDGAGWESYRVPRRVYAKYLSGGAKLTCEDIQPQDGTIIQHDQIGDTWYDFQKNGSMGRMISVTPDGYRHFSWMYCDGIYPGVPRFVDANCKNPLGTYIGQVHADYGNSGYSNQTHLHDGTSVVIHHRTAGTPTWASVLTLADAVCSGSFSKHWDLPDWIAGNTSGEEGMWPKAEVLYDPLEEIDYIHVVMTEGNTAGGVPVMVAYERCYISPTNPDTLYCQSYVNSAPATYAIKVNQNGLGSFAPISHFDSSCSVTPVVAVSAVSQKVGVAYLSPACDGSCDFLADCCWFESVSNGDDWIDGTQWPPIIHNITNFGCTGTERCFHDLSACYDYQDSLHVVYLTAGFDPAQPGYYQPGIARIYHWSKEAGVSMIHRNLQGTGADPGAHNCYLAKMSISAQDPIYHPGDDSVYLYCIWTGFDSSDNSASDLSNGDLYGAGSFDGGDTWGDIFNLTNTQTPGCSPGNCVSEHWSSMAQNMYDGDLHIQYICDRDAGGAIQDGTQWMSNPVMYLHLTDWSVVGCLPWHYRILEPRTWHLYEPPVKVPPGGSKDLVVRIYNRWGCPDLMYNVSGDHQCINITGAGMIQAGDSATVSGILDGSGVCSDAFIAGNLTITVDYAGIETINEPIQAIAADDYYECPIDPETVDTLYNGVLVLRVNANCGENITDSASFPDTAHDVFFEGGTIIATTSDADTLVGRFMREDRHAGVRDKLYTDECSQDWEPDFWLVYTKNVFMHDFEPPADYKWYWWELSKQIKFFKETAPDAYKHLVIKYVKVRRHDPPGWWPDQSPFTGYEDTYLGVLEDIDCPWDSSQGEPYVAWEENATNEGGYDPVNHIAWQRGFGSGEHPQYNDYYCGIALADADGEGPEQTIPYGSYCVKNNHYVYPQGGWGWRDGELYWLASQTGNNIEFPDSILDRSYIFTAAKIDAGDDPDAEATFTLILAAAPGGLGQLQDYVDTARAIVERERLEGYPVVCGDVNGKQGVSPGDIVYLINYLYRAGPPPVCPVNRGDVNSDGGVGAGDVVYMIGYLLRSGPAPDCPGIWGP